jgi:TctA family transporter
MTYILVLAIGFLGGVYVGARYGEKLTSIWYSIISK